MTPSLTSIETLPPLPPRPGNAHKGTFGTVIVVGGCATMPGAPALCASAALRSGAGLVKIAAPATVLPTAIAIEPAATGIVLDGQFDLEQLDLADQRRSAVLAVGPGIGHAQKTGELIGKLIDGPRSLVVDADGLNLLATTGTRRQGPDPPLVMTPHPGEFDRLAQATGITYSPTDPQQRPKAAAALAQIYQAVVVLKGQHTAVSDGQRIYINPTGNPALATAGSGDVLTGLIAALLAQGSGPFNAAILGAHLHGLAGDLWAADHGPSGLRATDLAPLLPRAFEQLRKTQRGVNHEGTKNTKGDTKSEK